MLKKSDKSGPWLVALGSFFWATDAVFRKPLTSELKSTVIVFYEHLINSIISIPLLIKGWKEVYNLKKKEWFSLMFIALGGSVLATVLFTKSFSLINPTVTILLQKTQPLIAILLAYFILKERFTRRFWVYAAIALIGAYFITFSDLSPVISLKDTTFLGSLYALLAAFFWGGSTVFGRVVLKKVSYYTLTGLRFVLGLLFLFIMLLIFGLPFLIKTSYLPSLLFMAVIPGFLALFIYYIGLVSTKASIATIGELTFPVASVILNWVFLDATLTMSQIIGSVILLTSIVLLSLENAKNNKI